MPKRKRFFSIDVFPKHKTCLVFIWFLWRVVHKCWQYFETSSPVPNECWALLSSNRFPIDRCADSNTDRFLGSKLGHCQVSELLALAAYWNPILPPLLDVSILFIYMHHLPWSWINLMEISTVEDIRWSIQIITLDHNLWTFAQMWTNMCIWMFAYSHLPICKVQR